MTLLDSKYGHPFRDVPFKDALEIPLLLRRTSATFFSALLGVFRAILFRAMLLRFRGSFGVTVSSSATGEGVLMRETEKRPFTVGDWSLDGVSDFAFGDFLGDAALTFGEAFLAGEGVFAFGDLAFGLFTSSNSCEN